MAEQILVNISQAPITVSMPSGKPVAILPGFAIKGDHFARFAMSGTLVTLASIPAGFSIRGVSDPMANEGIRSDSGSSTTFGAAPKSKAKPSPVPKTTAMALAESGVAPTEQAVANDVANRSGVEIDVTSSSYMGLERSQWDARLHSISDTTLAQQMKLSDLTGLARFLGIESADLLRTKMDLIQAIRVKVRGRAE